MSTGTELRAVFYARVSTEEEKQLNALEKQIQENKDVIRDHGWRLVGEYIDEGKTGTTTKRRNDYKRLLKDMTENKFDIVVCKDQDRLQRNTLDWYLFVDNLVTNNLKLFMYLDNKFFKPSEDALITGVKAIIAEEYSRNLSKKLNNSNKRRIERALNGEEVSAMGNGKSLAFKIVNGKWVKDEEEAKLGKKIFELYLEYDSIRKVRDWVNEHGYTNSVGKPFTSESISRILKNEKAKGVIVMGKYHHDFDKKKIVRRSEEELVRIPAPELAYVSEEVFDKVQERLRAKTGNGRGVNAYSDPLSGKIYCGSCGRKLWKHASNGYVNWMCASQVAKGDVECNGTRITTVAIRNIYKKITDNLEVNKGVVKQDIVKWLNELKATLSDTSVNEKIQKDLDKLERKRTKLLEAYLEDFISKDDYKAKYEAIEGQIEEKKKLLVPVEENEDIKVIESVLQNIDDEIDAYVKTLDMEESKVDFLIEHTKRITVLENRDIIIELDLVAGAIIAGKDFLLYVHDTMVLGMDEMLDECYSVGRRFPSIPLLAGFEREEKEKIIRAFPTARYMIFAIDCTKEQKENIRKQLKKCYENRYKYHYCIAGLPFILLQKEFFREKRYTCSSFIARVLGENGLKLFSKHFSLVTPKDFYELEQKEVIYEGELKQLICMEQYRTEIA